MHLKSAMEYKKAFFIQFFGMILNNGAFIFFWLILYNKFLPSFQYHNVSFADIICLWAVAASGYGLNFILFGGSSKINEHIVEGNLDIYLLYPKNPLIIAALSKSSISAWGDFIYGYILYFLFLPVSFSSFFWFTLVIFFSAFALFSFLTIINSFGFFLGNAQTLIDNLFNGMVSFGTYPEQIFSSTVKFFLFSILPVGFYVYLPVQIVLHFNIKLFLYLITGDLILILLAFLTFYNGLKRYESGNLFYAQK